MNCDVRQDLPIHSDVCFGEAIDEIAICHSVGATRSVDARDPQPPECAFLLAPISVGVRPTTVDCIFRCPEELASPAPEALGSFQYLVAPAARLESSFDARHVLYSCSGLRVADERLDRWRICRVDESLLAEVPLTLLALLGEDVVCEGLATPYLTLSGQSEAFCCAPVGFHFRHCEFLLILELRSLSQVPRGPGA